MHAVPAMAPATTESMTATTPGTATNAWVGRGWNSTPNREAFTRLADVYADHPDFRARYENERAGQTDYLVTAIRSFADRELA